MIGGGGHAQIILDACTLSIKGYYDDNGPTEIDCKYMGHIPQNFEDGTIIILAIGDNDLRGVFHHRFSNCIFPSIIHPKSVISKRCNYGIGNLFCAGSVIETGVIIGNFCIFNTNSSVNHECFIGDYTHIAPGCNICGNVSIGKNCLVGVGTNIIPKIRIGDNVIIGAGSTILKNIANNLMVYTEKKTLIKLI